MYRKNESSNPSGLLEPAANELHELPNWEQRESLAFSLTRRPNVHVLLPAYNEAKNLPALLMGLQSTLDMSGFGYCVTVVDDGSKDETASISEQASKEMPIHLIRHNPNQGLAAAIRSGLSSIAARCQSDDLIVTMDADNTHLPALMLPMIQRVQEGHDVVVASRFQPGAKVIGLTWDRRLLSFFARWIFSVLLPIPGVRDYTCGFRVFRARVIQDALQHFGDNLVSEKGFSCTVDLLLKLRGQSLVFGEVPMVLRYDQKQGDSKMQVWKTSRQTLQLIGKRLFWRA
jgi:dolichol-phosphate mannosyltransferase